MFEQEAVWEETELLRLNMQFFLFQILDFVYVWTFVKNKRRCGVGGD